MPPAALPPKEGHRLAALHSYEVLDTAGEEAFDEILSLAASLTGHAIALVSLVDDKRVWFKHDEVSMQVKRTATWRFARTRSSTQAARSSSRTRGRTLGSRTTRSSPKRPTSAPTSAYHW
jgi:hypothetical protein